MVSLRFKCAKIAGVILGGMFSILAYAQNQEGVVVLSDTVTGNQEQPKVLYIVPWQPADDDTILYQPLRTKLEQRIFDHVERPEHKRQVQFLEQLSSPTSSQ